mmetsp:Transcript_13992/g.19149  ORF Transcript_13992/g.19149 Transcript_13992/m.19149 type:complete len:124 (-) Transcript_13992:178-549(-)
MGLCQRQGATENATLNKPKDMIGENPEQTVSTEETKDYYLKKRRPGCTGMFWRTNPREGGASVTYSNDWPRDGAMLRGNSIEVGGKRWLDVTHVKQKGKSWAKACDGAYMPFEYNNHYYLEEA